MTCVYSWTDMGKPMEQVFQSWLFWATSGAPFTEVSLESRIRKRKSRMILCRPGAPGRRAGWTSETTVLQSWHTFIFAGNQCFFFRISLVFFGHVEFNEHFFLNCRYWNPVSIPGCSVWWATIALGGWVGDLFSRAPYFSILLYSQFPILFSLLTHVSTRTYILSMLTYTVQCLLTLFYAFLMLFHAAAG